MTMTFAFIQVTNIDPSGRGEDTLCLIPVHSIQGVMLLSAERRQRMHPAAASRVQCRMILDDGREGTEAYLLETFDQVKLLLTRTGATIADSTLTTH